MTKLRRAISLAVLIGLVAVRPLAAKPTFFESLRDYGMRISHPELPQKKKKHNSSHSAKAGAAKSGNASSAPNQPAQPPLQNGDAAATAMMTPTAPVQSEMPRPAATPAPEPAMRRATAASSNVRRDFPYAVPVPNRSGFVTSPYAPTAGLVDVRGFPSGTEVKDPYTGKVFLTP